MNYSAVALILLLAYMWQSGSLLHEIETVKRLLVLVYEMIEFKFNVIFDELTSIRNETIFYLDRLQNTTKQTLELVYNNGRNIDKINTKIDTLLAATVN
ncbi:GP16 [Perigonia lusca single nucleopolyhedrovirus]|uniref:GP16 n=1 Tax=Perigonia lusca single nucleopolyhedrovirus TaxID=1675865 RepID=A0A0M3WNY3_9ABAC|nr:GP16 [Perigonia lusca single nucleopolyhedrovirus]AKN80607.1 GP16 [Perigonia lusca single nucleopolyhedrovirus]